MCVAGVCAADYGGELQLEIVLGPLMDHTRSRWMVSTPSHDIEEVYCSVLQCVAVCCSVLKCVAELDGF